MVVVAAAIGVAPDTRFRLLVSVVRVSALVRDSKFGSGFQVQGFRFCAKSWRGTWRYRVGPLPDGSETHTIVDKSERSFGAAPAQFRNNPGTESAIQGYLAHKKRPPPKDRRRTLGIGLL